MLTNFGCNHIAVYTGIKLSCSTPKKTKCCQLYLSKLEKSAETQKSVKRQNSQDADKVISTETVMV